MSIDLDTKVVRGRIRFAGKDGSKWHVGYFRLDSGGVFIWYKPERIGNWRFLTEVDQVLEFENHSD